MIQARPIIGRPYSSEIEAVDYLVVADSPIDRILQKITKMALPDREHFEIYMRHKWRMNHKPSTLKGIFHTVSSFLTFYANLGKSQLQEIVSDDLEAYIEHEQDRGLKVTTARTRLNHLWAFLRFLIDQDIIDERILKRKIRLRVPDFTCDGKIRGLICEKCDFVIDGCDFREGMDASPCGGYTVIEWLIKRAARGSLSR